ncbi:MAG: amidohydrolase [Bdellovibrionales bacterium]|nr:amidohydrolase [Bdellovibrionales bacterium]
MVKRLFILILFYASAIPFHVYAIDAVDVLIKNGTIVTMNNNGDIIQNGSIAILNDKIVYVGQKQEKDFTAKTIIDAQNGLIIPGLVNGHTHIPMSLFRGVADDMELMDWLTNYIWPAEKLNVNPNFVYWGTKLGCLELIESGTTTFVDMYFFEDVIAQATEECGLRAILAQTLIDFPVPDNNQADADQRWENGISLTESFIQKWKDHPLITPAVGPHAPYTVSPDHLRVTSGLSKKHNVPFVIHVSETAHEAEIINDRYGSDAHSSIQYLHDLGVLSPLVIAAHAVWPTKNDVQLLSSSGTGVAHCPQSNLKLGSGVSPVPSMLDMEVPICLGTDGAASNNDLNLWEEINLAAILHKGVNHNPKELDAQKAFSMATILGAKAIHMDKSIGSLEPGKKADIVIVDRSSTHHIPYNNNNIYSELVYATKGSDVSTVIVNGDILLQNRTHNKLKKKEIVQKAKLLREMIDQSLKENR